MLTPLFQRLFRPFEHIPFTTLIFETVAVTLAAQTATLPIFAFTFNQVSIIAPFANLLTAPLLGTLIFLGIVLCISGSIALPLGLLCGWIIFPLLKYTMIVVSWCASIPGAFLNVSNLDPRLTWCYYGVLILLLSLVLRKWPEMRQLNEVNTTSSLFSRTINDRNIPYSQIREDSTIQIGTQASIQVLWPPKALHNGTNEELDNALIIRLVAPYFSMLLLGSAALSKFALSGLLTTIDPGFLKANIVQVVGEVGKAFPTELTHILQLASPSVLLVTPAALSPKLSKLATTSIILPSQLVVGSWQIIQTAQAGSTTISSTTHGWNITTE